MNIKTKLILGIGALFILIALFTVLSGIFINKMSIDTKNILEANYNTLDYSRKMLNALNEGIADSSQMVIFNENLFKQQRNITEIGEQELTEKLLLNYEKLLTAPKSEILLKNVRSDITDIMLLNMQAIQLKSAIARETASKAIIWVTSVGAFCFIIALILLINLPGSIANPIKELTRSIKEIATHNYSQRVNFEKADEFGEMAAAFNTMAQKLQEYTASNLDKLLIEKKRIETLIDNMADPVICLDDQNNVLFMNHVALNITGLKREDVEGRQIQDIAVYNDLIRSLIKELFDRSELTKPADRSVMQIYADNKESYFEKEILPINIIPTGEQNEKLIGNVILLRNVTPYKEMDYAKTNFIATVSHELKTPISSINLGVQLLENQQIGQLNEEQRNLLEGIKDDADRLLKISSELLNMTQVESGSIQLNILRADTAEIVNYAMQANQVAAEQKKIRFKLIVPPTTLYIMADSEKTAWVMTNLISNAVRYSHENAEIQVHILKNGPFVRLSVSDTGQGIAPQFIDRIFDRYFRIPGSNKEGTGLGLSISKEFIEAQGGKIWVKSDIGIGSTFTVELPGA